MSINSVAMFNRTFTSWPLPEESPMGFSETAEIESFLQTERRLEKREIEEGFWAEFQEKCRALETLSGKPSLTAEQAFQANTVSQIEAFDEQNELTGGAEQLNAEWGLTPPLPLDFDRGKFEVWNSTRTLKGEVRAYLARTSHLTGTYALGDKKPPQSPSEPGFFEEWSCATAQMQKSGELAAREEAYQKHIQQITLIDAEFTRPFHDVSLPTALSQEPNDTSPQAVSQRQGQWARAVREEAAQYYQRLSEIGEKFRQRYAEEDGLDARQRPMQRPQTPLSVSSFLPHHTFAEAREVQRAIGDGPSLNNWIGIDGEFAMRHAMPKETHQTKFSPSPRLLEYSQWLTHGPNERSMDLLAGELRRLSFDANLLFSVCLSLVIERGNFSASLDELGRLLGWEPKSAKERDQNRLKLWLWLLLFDSLRVVGLRRGVYKDPNDKKKTRSMNSDDDLLHISGTLADEQQRMDNVPFEVTLSSGPWIETVRGDKSLMNYLGNVRMLAAKKRGRFPARLAVKMGLSLLQHWREEAAKKETQIKSVGDENRLSVQVDPTTRKDLLTTYGQEAAREFEALLFDSDEPGVAVEYWDAAIGYLKKWQVVSYCKPTKASAVAITGYNWQRAWYEQEKLDIRPVHSLAIDVSEIHAAKQLSDKNKASARARKTTPIAKT